MTDVGQIPSSQFGVDGRMSVLRCQSPGFESGLAIQRGLLSAASRSGSGYRIYMLRGGRRDTRVFVYGAELSARSYPGGYVGTT